jgi:streptomycin 6-kinase
MWRRCPADVSALLATFMERAENDSPSLWLETIPDLLDACAARWGLQIGESLPGGYFGQVFACVDADGRALILKLSPPAATPALEAAALRLWSGAGAVRLRDWDPSAGALLLDRLVPGTPLPPDNDEQAAQIAARVLRILHATGVPATHPFPTLPQAFDSYIERVRFESDPSTVGVRLLRQCRDAAVRLWSTTAQVVLLHGDFIDKNLLLGASGYVAIDPMPYLGDPCSDVGFFASYHPPARLIASRARSLASLLGYDPVRAERWAAVWAVGEACETWRADSDELQAWMSGSEAERLLAL